MNHCIENLDWLRKHHVGVGVSRPAKHHPKPNNEIKQNNCYYLFPLRKMFSVNDALKWKHCQKERNKPQYFQTDILAGQSKPHYRANRVPVKSETLHINKDISGIRNKK